MAGGIADRKRQRTRPPLSRFLILSIVLLWGARQSSVAQVRPVPSIPEHPSDHGWRLTESLGEGIGAFLRKKGGVGSLVIYVGLRPESIRELPALEGVLPGAGFNIITTDLIHPAERGTAPPSYPEGLVKRFVKYALGRPGFRKKILIVAGPALKETLSAILESGDEADGLAVLRPGDANRFDPVLISLLSRSPAHLPVLWISSTAYPEWRDAKLLERNLQSEFHLSEENSALNLYTNTGNASFPSALAADDLFLNFLLLQNYKSRWIQAKDVFPGGCFRRPDGRSPVSLAGHFTGAKAEPDFCPLFLISMNGDLYRATGIGPTSCTYRRSGSSESLYCRY